jgi:hypothetical protein
MHRGIVRAQKKARAECDVAHDLASLAAFDYETEKVDGRLQKRHYLLSMQDLGLQYQGRL